MKVTYVKLKSANNHCPSTKTEKLLMSILTVDEERHLQIQSGQAEKWIKIGSMEIISSNMKQVSNLAKLVSYTSKEMEQIDSLNKASYKAWVNSLDLKVPYRDIKSLYDYNFDKLDVFLTAVWYMQSMTQGPEYWTNKKDRLAEEFGIDPETLEYYGSQNGQEYYEKCYKSPWAASSEAERDHWKLTKAIGDWCFALKDSQQEMDKVVNISMLMILLLNTDGNTTLVEKSKIQRMQELFVDYLYRYLKSKMSALEATNHIHRALMIIHDTQRIHELSQKRLQLNDCEPLVF